MIPPNDESLMMLFPNPSLHLEFQLMLSVFRGKFFHQRDNANANNLRIIGELHQALPPDGPPDEQPSAASAFSFLEALALSLPSYSPTSWLPLEVLGPLSASSWWPWTPGACRRPLGPRTRPWECRRLGNWSRSRSTTSTCWRSYGCVQTMLT